MFKFYANVTIQLFFMIRYSNILYSSAVSVIVAPLYLPCCFYLIGFGTNGVSSFSGPGVTKSWINGTVSETHLLQSTELIQTALRTSSLLTKRIVDFSQRLILTRINHRFCYIQMPEYVQKIAMIDYCWFEEFDS